MVRDKLNPLTPPSQRLVICGGRPGIGRSPLLPGSPQCKEREKNCERGKERKKCLTSKEQPWIVVHCLGLETPTCVTSDWTETLQPKFPLSFTAPAQLDFGFATGSSRSRRVPDGQKWDGAQIWRPSHLSGGRRGSFSPMISLKCVLSHHTGPRKHTPAVPVRKSRMALCINICIAVI